MNVTDHKLCGVVVGPTLQKALEQLDNFHNQADCIEIRVDLLESPFIEIVQKIMKKADLPTILTIRSQQQGGRFSGERKEQMQWVQVFCDLSPAYIDIESHLDPEFTHLVAKKYPRLQVICSYHDLQKTPPDLEEVFCNMQCHSASVYKLVTYANSSLDAMRMLSFVKQCRRPIIGFCMGEEGSFTRPVAPILGSLVSYASADDQKISAPGQFSIAEMVERFRIKEMTKNTDLFGLIGNPVNRSPSSKTHHHLIREFGEDAIYVQIRVANDELVPFLKFAKEIGFKGLSVTMPHKEQAAQMIHSPEQAVNTLRLAEEGYLGLNTDGFGALNAIEKHCSVFSSHVVILGAGGAAYGIAKEALQRGAKVTILNRTVERAEKTACRLSCSWGPLDHFGNIAEKGYDILINTIPSYDRCPVPAELLIPGKTCLEIISNPKETGFYLAALEKKCIVIPGMEMFLEQAKKQFEWWFAKYGKASCKS